MKNSSIKLLVIVISYFFILSGNSQDVITLKNGDEIKSKVVEVENETIKYKKSENLDGPTYLMPKADVFMIRYENGSKEVYNTPAPIPATPHQNTVIQTPVQKSIQSTTGSSKYKKEIVGGAVMTGLGVPCLAVGTTLTIIGVSFQDAYYAYGYPYDPNADDGTALLISGPIILCAGVALSVAGPIQLSKGIKHRRIYKSGRAFIDFSPINNKYFDTHFHAFYPTKLGSITLNF